MILLTAFKGIIEKTAIQNFSQNVRCKSAKKAETYYEVLNVSSDCSKRDIRNAYLQLSKQYHPDAKINAASAEKTARFVKITEAYQTLIKSSTRKQYDDRLSWNLESTHETAPSWNVRPNYTENPGPYYGIKGLNRVSNWQVALFLITLGIIGAIFGFHSVKQSFKMNRQVQDEISAEASSHHAAVVAEAKKYGNEEQIRRMIDRLAKDPLRKAVEK